MSVPVSGSNRDNDLEAQNAEPDDRPAELAPESLSDSPQETTGQQDSGQQEPAPEGPAPQDAAEQECPQEVAAGRCATGALNGNGSSQFGDVPVASPLSELQACYERKKRQVSSTGGASQEQLEHAYQIAKEKLESTLAGGS